MFDFPFVDLCLNLYVTCKNVDLDPLLSELLQKNPQQQHLEISQSSMEQYLARISSSH